MSSTILNLEPKSLWKNFTNLNAVPRASKKEEEVIQFMMDYGKQLGLETIKDHIGNVIIKKPATPGMEDRVTVVLQSHLDMVHQKNASVTFDFSTEGIKMKYADDWISAEGTTLGADNGIGVATIMALLESTDIAHPAVEALFTIDEETGMTGALELKGGLLTGGIMLNLDTEDDNELTIGCAGGIDITATGKYTEITNHSSNTFKLSVTGLSGGHSGMDIHKGLGNANKIMNRILYILDEKYHITISEIDGGGLRNAIPRESFSICSHNDTKTIEEAIEEISPEIIAEYNTTDEDLVISLEPVAVKEKCLDSMFQKNLLRSIYACQNGIFRMSPEVEGLVQTSNNLARVLVRDGSYQILCLTRSSVESEKDELVRTITSTFSMLGSEIKTSGAYPGWTPKPKSAIVQLMADIYKNRFDEAPHVNACHAGLECGILGQNYPDMDMISFGPNIRGAHSPDERVQVSSVQKFWGYFLEVLKEFPKK
jgi:dipeptidase D